MIKLENYEVMGWEHAIRGMRNPMNSWDKSDSKHGCRLDKNRDHGVNWDRHEDGEPTFCEDCRWCEPLCYDDHLIGSRREMLIGPNDHDLMLKLANNGSVHAKYRRMITVYVDITAPLYWWKEFDTYKVGTVANSCSTMHKIAEKEFTLEDFSHEHLMDWNEDYTCDCLICERVDPDGPPYGISPVAGLHVTISLLNKARELYLETTDKKYWWQMIQLLPSSYNQKRTVMLNYEVLAGIYQYRREHKLDEWREFCKWIESLPYSEIITCEEEK